MEFLLINHPLDCPVCDKGGECPLQNQAMSNGRGESRFDGVKRTFPKPINISAQVLLDRERCVLCARCTRFSAQIAGDPFIELIERGALQQVGIYEKEPFESYFSGNTIQICPVGALTSADYRFRSRPFDLVSTPSVAEHDACGSAIRVDHRRGRVMRRLSGNDPEVNEEWITDKDRFAFTYAARGRPDHLPPGARRGRLAPSRVLAGGLRRRGPRAARRRRLRRAHRWPGHRRGRLRLQQVRPGRARHQRHRLPLPAALRRGGALPRRRGRAPPSRLVRRPRDRTHRRPRRPRARGRGRRDLPAAAQGVPQGDPRRLHRAVHLARPAQDERPADRHPARRRGRGARRPGRAGRVRRRQDRRDPRGRAARHLARRPHRRLRPGRQDRCPAGLGPAPRRRPRRPGDRLPAQPASRRPSRVRRRPPASTSPPPGASTRCPRPRAATPTRSSPPSSPASSAAWSSAASTPTTPPTPPPPAPPSPPPGSWSRSSCARPT